MFQSSDIELATTVDRNKNTAGTNATLNAGVQTQSHNNYHKVKEHWRTALISAVVICCVCLGVPLGVVYGVTNPPTEASSSSQAPQSAVSRAPLLMIHLGTSLTLIISMESPTASSAFPTSTSSPTQSTTAAQSTFTKAPLLPRESCTADSQCSPNICYTQEYGTNICCGSTVPGCPGWTCSAKSDCVAHYGCVSVTELGVSTCCGLAPYTNVSWSQETCYTAIA